MGRECVAGVLVGQTKTERLIRQSRSQPVMRARRAIGIEKDYNLRSQFESVTEFDAAGSPPGSPQMPV